MANRHRFNTGIVTEHKYTHRDKNDTQSAYRPLEGQ